jgi:hypothetical protein
MHVYRTEVKHFVLVRTALWRLLKKLAGPDYTSTCELRPTYPSRWPPVGCRRRGINGLSEVQRQRYGSGSGKTMLQGTMMMMKATDGPIPISAGEEAVAV